MMERYSEGRTILRVFMESSQSWKAAAWSMWTTSQVKSIFSYF